MSWDHGYSKCVECGYEDDPRATSCAACDGQMQEFPPPQEITKEKCLGVEDLRRHLSGVVDRKRKAGEPTCADDVPALDKLAALGEEYGEVCELLQGGEPTHSTTEAQMLRDELLDLATAATLWAAALSEGPKDPA